MKPLYDPEYDRLWQALQDLDIPVNVHSGTGNPDYGQYPTVDAALHHRGRLLHQRPFVQFALCGIFDRLPRLKFVMTEAGCAWMPPLLAQLDTMMKQHPRPAPSGEIRYTDEERKVALLAVGSASPRTAGWA